MAHPYHHALSSVKKWGGSVDDYLPLHAWFDHSKEILADFRHRALRHHAEGIFMLEKIFGPTVTLSSGRVIPTRWIGEQHVLEDLGRIPSFADWARAIAPEPWMGRAQPLHLQFEQAGTAQPRHRPRQPKEKPHDHPYRVAGEKGFSTMISLHPRTSFQCYQTNLPVCRAINRDRLYDALSGLNISSAVVCFEAGDGRTPITTYEIIRDGRTAPVPPATVSLLTVASGGGPSFTTTLPLARALDTFTFDALYEFHPDWQQARGAFGTITISTHSRSARLEIKFHANYAVWTATDL